MTDTNSRAKELQTAGQTFYRKGDYNAALFELSQALSHATQLPLQLSILDNRAAVQEKLGENHYRSALKDARKMMLLQKTSVKGYLRAGKILQLMGKWNVALETYRYGLKQILSDDSEGKRLLEGMHQKVVNRLEAARNLQTVLGVDPLRILPSELVDMIFKYLPFESLMLLQRVSRGWRQFLVAYHRSYTTLDFSAAQRPVTKLTIKTYLKRARGAVMKAILKRTDQETLGAISIRCKHLSELAIRSSSGLISDSIVSAVKLTINLTILELGCETTTSAVVDIIKFSNKLESLRCGRIIPSDRFDWDGNETRVLKKLALMWHSIDGYFTRYVHSNFDKMLECLPELQELELIKSQLGLFPMPLDLSELCYLEVVVLRSAEIWMFPRLADSVRRLDLSENPHLKYRVDQDAIPQGLESLAIVANPRIGNDEVLCILEATDARSLRSLDLGMCPKIDAGSLDWLLDTGHGGNMEHLSLEGNQSFGDQVTRELGRMTNLKRLNVGNTKISGVGVSNLIYRKGSKLEWLGLDYCPNVGRDAIESVKAEGIEVSHKVESLKGGRKVRY
ncbi:hypothetical protein BDD12DRAFT_894964 [Trichophaea hybrida]|nr:hypothetical protein BDD12DRAFT_894964 [Trichophaea hybrida]